MTTRDGGDRGDQKEMIVAVVIDIFTPIALSADSAAGLGCTRRISGAEDCYYSFVRPPVLQSRRALRHYEGNK